MLTYYTYCTMPGTKTCKRSHYSFEEVKSPERATRRACQTKSTRAQQRARSRMNWAASGFHRPCDAEGMQPHGRCAHGCGGGQGCRVETPWVVSTNTAPQRQAIGDDVVVAAAWRATTTSSRGQGCWWQQLHHTSPKKHAQLHDGDEIQHARLTSQPFARATISSREGCISKARASHAESAARCQPRTSACGFIAQSDRPTPGHRGHRRHAKKIAEKTKSRGHTRPTT